MSILGLVALVLVLFLISECIVSREGLDNCAPSPENNSVAIKTLQTQVKQLQDIMNAMTQQQAKVVNARLKQAKKR